ncbi:MAG: hypothetical protein J6Y78_09260 [Paludibacteraceae bacterium]|nr:hypothetical protein [Paludibacteraceae bacterium]
MRYIRNTNIYDLLKGGSFLNGEERSEVVVCQLHKHFLNKFDFIVKSKQNKYLITVLFDDIFTIAKDNNFTLTESVDEALHHGNVYVKCTCPSWSYYGFDYMATKLRYKFGKQKETRFPEQKNPNLEGTVCKHVRAVLNWCLRNEIFIEQSLREIYNDVEDGGVLKIYNSNGNTYQIGIKGESRDPFVEEQEEEEMKTLFDTEENEKSIEEKKEEIKEQVTDTEETTDTEEVTDEEEEITEDDEEVEGEWTIPDPTEGGFVEDDE